MFTDEFNTLVEFISTPCVLKIPGSDEMFKLENSYKQAVLRGDTSVCFVLCVYLKEGFLSVRNYVTTAVYVCLVIGVFYWSAHLGMNNCTFPAPSTSSDV